MNGPLVSVVIVTYNHAGYVIECLDSLKKQTYSNWELIVADDASKDKSVEKMEGWLEENKVSAVRVFHKQNAGFCATLNECLVRSKGTYVKIIAADDFMGPYLLEKSVNTLEELGEDYGLVYSDAEIVDGNSVRRGESFLKKVSPPAGWIFDDLYTRNFIPALSTVIRKSAQESIGLYDPSLIVEDLDFWLRLSAKFKVAYIPEILSFYRIHGQNLSLTTNLDADLIRIYIKNDTQIRFKAKIKENIMQLYYKNAFRLDLLQFYKNYQGKDAWLYWCLKNNIPYKAFRLVDKLRGN